MTTSTLALKREARAWQREQRLRRLGFDSYADYLDSPEWQSVKGRYRASSLPQDCHICGAAAEVMHHKTYDRVGEEDLTDLAPLCHGCHGIVHALECRGELDLDFDGFVEKLRKDRYRGEVERRRNGLPRSHDLREQQRLHDLIADAEVGVRAAKRQGSRTALQVRERRLQRLIQKAATGFSS